MPEIMPPQLAGVQQRPFYVKARSVITAVSLVWLVLAVAGYGSFSGGTTSLALSLALMYGTGVAILVVVSAAYRLVKRSAVRRIEHAPEDTAAAAFIDATRFAAEEIRAALTPARPGTRPAASPWSAASQQVAAPVFREPGAEGVFARELLSSQEGAAVPVSGAPAADAPASSVAVSPETASGSAGTSVATTAAAKTPAVKNPSASKSVVNKKASAKKKKGSKPRPAQAAAKAGKQAPAEAGKAAKQTAPQAGAKTVPSAAKPGGPADSRPATVQDLKHAA